MIYHRFRSVDSFHVASVQLFALTQLFVCRLGVKGKIDMTVEVEVRIIQPCIQTEPQHLKELLF